MASARERLLERLAFDYEVMCALSSESLGEVRAFVSRSDVDAGRDATEKEGLAGLAAFYIIEFRFEHVTGPGETADSAVAFIDLLAGGRYPYSAPNAYFIQRPLPWSPHVHPSTGLVCLGDGWRDSGGRMLLGQLVIHLMRLANLDEPDRGEGYLGWNGRAAHYWRTVMRRRPYLPDLAYPPLPCALTHGVPDPGTAFAPVAADGFVPLWDGEPGFRRAP